MDSGLVVTYEAIREWVSKFAPLLTEKFKQKRKYKAGPSHYIDETYIRIKGKWVYVYRGIDRNGNLVNTMVSETRDMDAAKKFFSESEEVCGIPERVTTDGHSAYPRAIAEVNGTDVKHRVNGYLHNFTEQSHRPLKQRYYPMLGFKSLKGASIFCPAHDELRNFFKGC